VSRGSTLLLLLLLPPLPGLLLRQLQVATW
jgi:hypothetical protein